MNTCICIYIYIYSYKHIYVLNHICSKHRPAMHRHVYVHVYIYLYVCIYMYTFLYTYIYIYILYTFTNVCTYRYNLYVRTYMCIFVYVYTYLYPFVYIYIAGTGCCGLWPHKEGQEGCGSDCGTESTRENGMYVNVLAIIGWEKLLEPMWNQKSAGQWYVFMTEYVHMCGSVCGIDIPRKIVCM